MIAALVHRNSDGSQALNPPKLLLHSAALYNLLRFPSDSASQIEVTTPAALQTMDAVLADELAYCRSNYSGPAGPDSYLDVQLTGLYQIVSFDDLMEGAVVNVYLYDFGFVMDDLVNAQWAGGPYVDSQLRYHPGGGYYHLFTVERQDTVDQHAANRNEFQMEPDTFNEIYGAAHGHVRLREEVARQLGLDA